MMSIKPHHNMRAAIKRSLIWRDEFLSCEWAQLGGSLESKCPVVAGVLPRAEVARHRGQLCRLWEVDNGGTRDEL